MTTLQPFGLTGFHCEECGRPKTNRLFDILTGCKTCDESITSHRCEKRPPLSGCPVGTAWECPDCGTAWLVGEEEDTCGECGHSGVEPVWQVVFIGTRVDTAPKHVPRGWPPLLNLLPQRQHWEPAPMGACHRARAGFMIHVKPGCRCR